MALHSQFLRKLSHLLSARKRFATIGLISVILLLAYLFYHHSNAGFDKDEYLIGIDNRWKELQLFEKERSFSAFSQDVLSAIAKEEKIRFRMVNSRSSEMEDKLTEGEFQGIISGIKPTEIKQRTFVFSDPYYALGPVLTVSTSSEIEGWNEMARKIIGIYAFSPTIMELQRDHAMQVKQYDDIKKALEDLNDHKIDGVIFPVLPSLIYTKTFYPGLLKVTTPPLDDEGVHLVALKNRAGETLIKRFNEGLEKIKKNGVYEQLLERWDLINTENIHD